jgi:dihydrofolate reductase
MGKVVVDISVSVDGYVAGPRPTLEEPLGENGERLHDWVVALRSWRETHGLEGGEENESSELFAKANAARGAAVMGRKMFSGGEGPWEEDPKAEGWWGDEPPFGYPVFIVTHHEREPVTHGATTYTFVTDGVESAIAQARTAAGDRDVLIAGGAEIAQQSLRAGLVDELWLHVAPVLLGGGRRLLDDLGPGIGLEPARVDEAPNVTHLRYTVTSADERG